VRPGSFSDWLLLVLAAALALGMLFTLWAGV